MKFLNLALVFVLLYTAYARPSTEDEYGENLQASHETDTQNDDDADYDSDPDLDHHDDDDDDVSINPEMFSKPQNFTVKIGDTVALPCNRSNHESHVTMWKHNAELLYQDSIFLKKKDDRFVRMKNGTLVIKNITAAETGQYMCYVMTSSETPVQVIHTIMLIEKPEIISLTADKTELHTGETLRLTCRAKGVPTPKITWSKEGKHIGDYKPVLEISNVEHDNAGVYQCLADNKAGVHHKSITINVNHKPIVRIERISSGIVNPNEPFVLELHCSARGHPEPTVMWMKDNKILESDNHVQLGTEGHIHKLLISKANKEDLGKYKCHAVNSIGDVERAITLDGKPSVARYETKKAISENGVHGTRLTWKFDSFYPATSYNIAYKKKDEDDWKMLNDLTDLEQPSGSTYTVSHIFKDLEAGVYQAKIQATNNFGTAEFSKVYDFGIKKHHHHHNDMQVIYKTKEDEDVPAQEHTKPSTPDKDEPAQEHTKPSTPDEDVPAQEHTKPSSTVFTEASPNVEPIVDTHVEDTNTDTNARTGESSTSDSSSINPVSWLVCIASAIMLLQRQ